MLLETPPQARRAIYLLWMSLFLSIVDSALSLEPIEEAGPEFQILMAAVLVRTFAISALLIYFASRRHNWARIVLLLLTVIGLSMYYVWPPDFTAHPWWSWTLTGVVTLLDIAALVMLFSGSAVKWYSLRAVRSP